MTLYMFIFFKVNLELFKLLKILLIRYNIELCLLPVGWGSDQRGFGEQPGMKTQALNLIRSIRTVMRSKIVHFMCRK